MAKIKFDMEEAFKTIPEEPKGFKDFCIRQFVPIAIFYRRNGKLSDCTCGKCGENFVTDNVPVRKVSATCPVCGHKGYWEWKRDVKQHWDDRSVGMVQRTTDNNIVIRLYRIHQHFQQYTVAVQTIAECRRYFLYLGDAFKVHNGSVYTSRGRERRWGEMEHEGLWIENLYPGWKEEIKNSNLKYFDADAICGKRTNDDEKVKGMIAFANNPAIEMYAKSGMKGLVRHLVAKEGKTKYVNRREKSLRAQLRIEDKSRINQLIKHEGGLGYLRVYQQEKKNKVKYTDEQIEFLVKVEHYYKGIENATYLLKFMSIQQLMNRCKKYEDQEGGYRHTSSVLSAYYDYLKMREELGYDLTNEVYTYPNNLKEKHDLMVKEKIERADELHMEKMQDKYLPISERYETLCKKYCFEQDGMFIRPAQNAREIVAEGRELHHCVGREMYLERHAQGKSFILFLRKKETPDVPYYTIEIKDTEIVQWYGIRDTKPDEILVKSWLKNFTDYLLNKKTQKDLKVAV